MTHDPFSRYPSLGPPLRQLLRARDFDGAEALCRADLSAAQDAQDALCAPFLAGMLATLLSSQGRHDEAWEAGKLAQRLDPANPDWALATAARLRADLGKPTEAMAELAQARHSIESGGRPHLLWLTEKGLTHLALGEPKEAVACFQEMATPNTLARLAHIRTLAGVDLRLVGALVRERLAFDEAHAYLLAAQARGRALEELDYLEPIDALLASMDRVG